MNKNIAENRVIIIIILICTLIVLGCNDEKDESVIENDQETIVEYLTKNNRTILNTFQIIPTVVFADTLNRVFKIQVSNDELYLVNSEVVDLKYLENFLSSSKDKLQDLIIFLEVSPEDNIQAINYLKLLKILKKLNLTRISFGHSPYQDLDELYYYRNGKEEAMKDIDNEKLKIKVYGLLEEWFDEYSKILSTKYHIEIEGEGFGCDISNEGVTFVNNYNAISIAEIKRRYGNNILNEVETEAKYIWKNKLQH